MVTNPTNSPTSRPNLESLTHVDITKLSQSELHALSLCSSSSFDLCRTDDLIIPKIDRIIFNESAGSRRQTYSRLRPAAAPRQPHQSTASLHHHRRRIAGLLPTPKLPPVPNNDPELSENKRIVNILKKLIENRPLNDPGGDTEVTDLQNRVEVSLDDIPPIGMDFGDKKRKRGRKPNVKVDNGKVLDIMNKDGVAVDLAALAKLEDPYGEELRSRTAGLGTEDEFLGFMRNLEGLWGSTRRKRKIVNASDFGDALPVGWKLLLGLRRKEGRVSLYCRRYVSPSGQQFASCKEASSYLQSYFGQNSSMQLMDPRTENIQQASKVANESPAGITCNDEDSRQDIISSSTLPSTLSIDYEKEVSLLGIENLAEVQVRDLFECYKCNMAFDEKDPYLQHLMSSHQKTTRRYRLNSSVGDGVILKDGKYECQFCHKIFQEKRRYNSHVGSHVRNCVRRSDVLPGQVTVQKSIESLSKDVFPPRVSKMDALIEIAQNSILEASVLGPNDEPKGVSSVDKLNVLRTSEKPPATPDRRVNFDSSLSEPEFENSRMCRNLDQDLTKQDSECTIEIAQNSIFKASVLGPNDEPKGVSYVDKLNVLCTSEIPAATPDRQVNFDSSLSEPEFENSTMCRNLDQELTMQDSECTIPEETMEIDTVINVTDFKMNQGIEYMAVIVDKEEITKTSFTYDVKDCVNFSTEQIDNTGVNLDRDCDIHRLATPDNKKICDDTTMSLVCTTTSDHPKFDVMNKLKESKLESCYVLSRTETDNNVVNGTTQQSSKENEILSRIPDSSMSPVQSLSRYPLFYSVSDKGEGEFSNVDQKLDNITGFEELKLDEIETLNFGSVTAQEFTSLQGVHMNMADEADLGRGFDSSVQFDTEEVMLNIDGLGRFTTVCVWCRNEFNQEPLDYEIESDSVGYMCPTCKAKISGQLNVFNSSLSMNPHHF